MKKKRANERTNERKSNAFKPIGTNARCFWRIIPLPDEIENLLEILRSVHSCFFSHENEKNKYEITCFCFFSPLQLNSEIFN